MVNASTAGVGAPVVSVAEDAAAISLSLVAVFAPLFVLVLLAVLAWIVWSLWRRFKRLTGRRRPEPEYVPLSS